MVHELNTLAETFGKGAEHHGKQEAHLHSNADLLFKLVPKANTYYSEHTFLLDMIQRVVKFSPTRERVKLPFGMKKKDYKFTNTRIL